VQCILPVVKREAAVAAAVNCEQQAAPAADVCGGQGASKADAIELSSDDDGCAAC